MLFCSKWGMLTPVLLPLYVCSNWPYGSKVNQRLCGWDRRGLIWSSLQLVWFEAVTLATSKTPGVLSLAHAQIPRFIWEANVCRRRRGCRRGRKEKSNVVPSFLSSLIKCHGELLACTRLLVDGSSGHFMCLGVLRVHTVCSLHCVHLLDQSAWSVFLATVQAVVLLVSSSVWGGSCWQCWRIPSLELC